MSKWQDPVSLMMLQHDDPVLFQKIYEQTGTGTILVIFIHQSFLQCISFHSIRVFKEKLSEIRGWGQADRHFAAHYRLFLN
jgi:hypothetical protein